VPTVLKSASLIFLEPSGPIQACNGIAIYLIYFISLYFGEKQEVSDRFFKLSVFNPSNGELNPICHLLALLEAHHILHVCRVRVKLL
jgi:hypothetical protein